MKLAIRSKVGFVGRYAYWLIGLALLFFIGIDLIPPNLYDSMPEGNPTISVSFVGRLMGQMPLLLYGAALVLPIVHKNPVLSGLHKIVIVSGTVFFSYGWFEHLSHIQMESGLVVVFEAVIFGFWITMAFKSFWIFKSVVRSVRS